MVGFCVQYHVALSTLLRTYVSYAQSTGHLVITTKTVSRLDFVIENGRGLQDGDFGMSVSKFFIFQ